MAVRLASGSDYLLRLSSLLGTGARTWMCWVRYPTLPTGYGTILGSLNDLPALYTQWAAVFSYANRFDLEFTGVATPPSFANPVAGQWYHIAWTKNTTTSNIFYVNAVSVGTEIAAIAFAPVAEVLGGDSFGDGIVEVAYCRQWSTSLFQSAIHSEMFAQHAIRTDLLWQDTPLISDLQDVSGNGRHWNQVGSGSFVEGPSQVPPNRHITDAIALPSQAPFDISTTVPANFPRSAGGSPALWWKYTAPPNPDLVLGLWPNTDLTAGFIPGVRIWLGPDFDDPQAYVLRGVLGGFDLQMAVGVSNAPLSIPIRAGVTYYLELFNAAGASNPNAEELRFSARRPPTGDVPPGSIMVSDDTGLFPLAALDPVTGEVLSLIPFRSDAVNQIGNESDDTLPNGVVLAEDSALAVLHLYDHTYTEIATIPYPPSFASPSVGDELNDIVTNRRDAFYVANVNPTRTGVTVIKVSDGGMIQPQSWTLPMATVGVRRVIAPSLDETRLYHGKYFNADTQVDIWDLVNDVAVGMLAPSIANYRLVRDILVLSNGDILVGYQRSAGTVLPFIRRYTPAGTIVQDYAVTETLDWVLNRMAFDVGTSDLFIWAWMQSSSSFVPFPGRSQFLKIRVSDGTIAVASPLLPWFEIGSRRAPASADPERFGHSQSCPFWIQQAGPVPLTACPPISWLQPAGPGCVGIGEV